MTDADQVPLPLLFWPICSEGTAVRAETRYRRSNKVL